LVTELVGHPDPRLVAASFHDRIVKRRVAREQRAFWIETNRIRNSSWTVVGDVDIHRHRTRQRFYRLLEEKLIDIPLQTCRKSFELHLKLQGKLFVIPVSVDVYPS
jgi:hypothetical protein